MAYNVYNGNMAVLERRRAKCAVGRIGFDGKGERLKWGERRIFLTG
jgi:hypothetical protein